MSSFLRDVLKYLGVKCQMSANNSQMVQKIVCREKKKRQREQRKWGKMLTVDLSRWVYGCSYSIFPIYFVELKFFKIKNLERWNQMVLKNNMQNRDCLGKEGVTRRGAWLGAPDFWVILFLGLGVFTLRGFIERHTEFLLWFLFLCVCYISIGKFT